MGLQNPGLIKLARGNLENWLDWNGKEQNGMHTAQRWLLSRCSLDWEAKHLADCEYEKLKRWNKTLVTMLYCFSSFYVLILYYCIQSQKQTTFIGHFLVETILSLFPDCWKYCNWWKDGYLYSEGLSKSRLNVGIFDDGIKEFF